MLYSKDNAPTPNFANANAPALPTFPSKNKPTDGSILLTAEALTEAREVNALHSTDARIALAAANVKGYDTAKENHTMFSAATFAGGKKQEHLTGTFAAVIDFDRELTGFEYDLILDHRALITLSRSGKGFHAVFLIAPNTKGNPDQIAAIHSATVTALAESMGFAVGDYDKCSLEAARRFYLWNDSNAFENEEPEPFPLATPSPAQATHKPHTSHNKGTNTATQMQLNKALATRDIRAEATFTKGNRHTYIVSQAGYLNSKGVALDACLLYTSPSPRD